MTHLLMTGVVILLGAILLGGVITLQKEHRAQTRALETRLIAQHAQVMDTQRAIHLEVAALVEHARLARTSGQVEAVMGGGRDALRTRLARRFPDQDSGREDGAQGADGLRIEETH